MPHFQKALQLKPDFVAAYLGLGSTYNCPSKFDADGATRAYRGALNLDPNCAGAYRGLAAVLVTQRRFDDAILQYRKALELEPDDSLARESLDSLVQQQGTKKTVPHETKKVSDQPASTPATAAAAATKTPIASVVAKVADSSAAEKKATESKDANENGKGVTETTRPAWVDAGPQLVDDVYQMVVSVGPYTTLLECDAKLPEAIRRAVDEYAEIALGSDVVGTAWLPDAAFCRQLIKDRWQEVKPYSVGPMTQLYVLLQFDRKAKEGIADACRQGVIERRVGHAAVGMAVVLGLLAAAYGASQSHGPSRREAVMVGPTPRTRVFRRVATL